MQLSGHTDLFQNTSLHSHPGRALPHRAVPTSHIPGQWHPAATPALCLPHPAPTSSCELMRRDVTPVV